MPGLLTDCYVLSSSRSSADALQFLQAFVSDCSPRWNDADPSEVLGIPPGMTLTQIVQFLETHPELAYSMYFRNNAGVTPYFAILCYCNDGSLIFGLSGDESAASAISLLNRLEAHAGSKGYWSVEEAPAGSKREFLTRAGQYA